MRIGLLLVAAIGIVCIGLPSCKKGGCNGFILQSYNDSLATNTFTVTNGKPVKLAEYNGSYTTYHYNSSGLIDTISNYDVSGLVLSYSVYTYNGNNLATATGYSSANNNTGALTVISKDQYTYTGNNLTQDNQTLFIVGDTTYYNIYYSYNSSNDVVSAEEDQAFPPTFALRLVYKRYYTYDNKSNPWGFLAKYMQYFSANNILTEVDSLVPANNMVYSYQYNSNGYPLSLTESTTNIGSYSKTVQYNYCE